MKKFGSSLDELLSEIDETLDKKNEYVQQRQQSIHELKDKLYYFSSSVNGRKEIEICPELYNQYQSYIFDSSFHYIEMV